MADVLGYIASCAVLATFLMRTMGPLRLVAIISNVLFLVFGYIQHIYPVFFLHVALLPINAWRLAFPDGPSASCAPMSRAWAPMSRAMFASNVASRPYALWFAGGLLAGLAASLAVMLVMNPRLV
jgi:hypothetical protein